MMENIMLKKTGFALDHGDLVDMPDSGGTNSDHDSRYYTETEIDDVLENGLQEPTGFGLDQPAESTISFVNGTRIFTIEPTTTEYFTFHSGTKKIHTSAENVTIDDTEGLHIIYFEDDANKTLTVIANPTRTQISEVIRLYASVAWIYWDKDAQEQIYFGNERHGSKMDGDTHANLHFTRGAQYLSGLALNNINADASGNLDSSAQFGVENGIITDEDLPTFAFNNLPQPLVVPAEIPMYYFSGTNKYLRNGSATTFPIKTTGTGLAAYNNDTGGGDWGLIEAGSGKFVVMHYYCINDINHPIIGIVGQNEYLNKAAAREGANDELNTLQLAGLDFKETIPIASVIFETKSTFTNQVKSRIVTTDTGEDYVDWRYAKLDPSAVAATDHGNLAGLQDDDHTQYYLSDGSRPILDDVKLPIGTDGTTYFIYVSATSKLELWVNGVKRADWA